MTDVSHTCLLTGHGKELSEKYNENYFNELLPYLDAISDTEADCMTEQFRNFTTSCVKGAFKMTDKTADFTQGSILKKLVAFMRLCWCTNPSGSIWSG